MEKLASILRSNKRILFVGIGNVLKQDDGAGVYISNRIRNTRTVQTLTVEQSIENYMGKINILNPQILILTDCTSFNEPPGYCELLSVERLKDYTTNTHNISLKNISAFFSAEVYILGIQPESISFGEGLSAVVRKKADSIIRAINQTAETDMLNEFKEV